MFGCLYCTFQVRLSRLPADISEKQSHQGSPQRKPKPASPSRTPVEKTSLGTRELNELLAKELNRKKDITKKSKSLGSAERKTMKQLKALAKPVLGTTVVETVLSPTKTVSTSGQHKQGLFEKFTPEKPAPKPVDKPTERAGAAAEKSITKERVDSPAENSQSELSAEEALVQESMIQAMLQQHSAMQQLGQSQASLAAAAALATASTGGGLDGYKPILAPNVVHVLSYICGQWC